MRYHLDTIPVWDAFKQDEYCPFCSLFRKREVIHVDRTLGGAVMEPDTRIRVNEQGFCPEHHRQLYALQNRLGHALIMESHLKVLTEKAEKILASGGSKGGFFRKDDKPGASQQLRQLTSSCIICDSIRNDIAQYAFEIERIDLGMAGGKQDQYAATFGGVNFIEFREGDRVIVNPLSIKDSTLYEWAMNTVLIFTNQRRKSAKIIEQQVSNVKQKKSGSVEAMHQVKAEAFRVKKALLQDDLATLGDALNTSWINKKKMAEGISNEFIDSIYETAMAAGATGGKISGAGGGGFMFFYCPGNTRYAVEEALSKLEIGEIYDFEFSKEGLTTWTVK